MSTTNRRSVMMLYSDKMDPVGHAVRIVLAEKDINVEIQYIDAGDPPVELRELNPYTDTDTLTLADRDLVLYDIQVIMEYLDERFPHPPLMPVDPVARATCRQLCFRVRRDIYVPLAQLQGGNEIALANARKTIRDNLTAIAGAFDQKPYFMSDEYSLVDCCLAPVLWRLPYLGIKLPAAAKPLQKYAERLFARPGFRKSLSDAERELQP
ncbi:RNA polymerase-associated protein [Methylohalomonas lacus]|uniref:RNA polymerase-associated protein n=2 Tax=Methylohalomonas lacus TaxID=398773 RepID=A0AAE3HJG5_9GAMM|nr:glutathione binding-like protein [Methylohalomonas lacus]MCS3902236.1 RNA polymerase-associated protein [Methylohalomonas lacus]